MIIYIDDQIKAVAREIAMRKRLYPQWVDAKSMRPEKAAEEIAAMEAVLETLKTVQRLQQVEKGEIKSRPWNP